MSGPGEQSWRVEDLSLANLDTSDLGELTDDDFAVDELLSPSDELGRVARRISGQYVEILASFAGQAFAGRASPGLLAEVQTSIDALLRLAVASGNTDQIDILTQFQAIHDPLVSAPNRSRERESAVIALREWIPRFAETLENEDGSRLNNLVSWRQGQRPPLIDELSSLKGIGPKRLQRLYAAGLYTVEAVATADPIEVAQVTGLPTALAHRVVDATRVYAVEERRRCLETLRDRAVRLRGLLKTTKASADDQDLAKQALAEVEGLFARLLEDIS